MSVITCIIICVIIIIGVTQNFVIKIISVTASKNDYKTLQLFEFYLLFMLAAGTFKRFKNLHNSMQSVVGTEIWNIRLIKYFF